MVNVVNRLNKPWPLTGVALLVLVTALFAISFPGVIRSVWPDGGPPVTGPVVPKGPDVPPPLKTKDKWEMKGW